MRYQNRYPKTMTGAEIRLLNRWMSQDGGLALNGGRDRSMSDGQFRRALSAAKVAFKEARRLRKLQDQADD